MRLAVLTGVGGLTRLWSRPDRRLQLAALLVGLGIIAAVWALRGQIASLDPVALGYPGVFFLSLLGSFALVLPVPGLISLCGVSVLLNPFVLGLLAGIGETLGETSGYAIGYGGGSMIERRGFYVKLKDWMERRGTLVIFLVSIIPNPVFDVVGIAAGSVRFPLIRFLAIVLVGKTLKGVMVGYTCYYGVTLLPWVE
jgi:membrane protein YqaA with SNARE-associated domain